MVQNNDLSKEVGDTGSRLVLRVGGNIASLDVLDRDILDVESNVVSGPGLGERLVVHFNGLDLSGQVSRGESDDHAGLENTSLNSAHGYCSNTSDFVDILEGKSKGLVGRSGGRNNGVKGVQKSGSGSLALLPLNVPSHVLGGGQHVVTVPSRDGDESDSGGVISDLLDEARHLLLDFLEPSLAVRRLGRVHLVDTDDQLFHTKSIGKESVLSGLTVFGDTSLEL